MNPIDIYELHNDADRHEVRIRKIEALIKKANKNKDLNNFKKLEIKLSECIELRKRLNDFFTDYIKQN